MNEEFDNEWGARRGQVSPTVRVVLADASSSGTLHYLLEAEGFQVVGSAADEWELRRVLRQDIRPDVIVLDRDITVASVSIATAYAPDATLIVVWPDGVQPPTGARRVAPWLIYRELGPTIRAALDQPVEVESSPATTAASATPTEDVGGAEDPQRQAFGRTAARSSVMAIVLIATIVMTMGAVLAFGGEQVKERKAAERMVVTQAADRPSPSASSTAHRSQPSSPPVKTPMECDQGPEWSSNDRAADVAPGAHDKRCPTKAGGTANKPAHAGHRQGHGPPEEPGQSNDAGGHGDDAQEHQADAHRQNDTTGGHNDGTNGQSGQHGRAEDPSDAPATEGPNADHGPKT